VDWFGGRRCIAHGCGSATPLSGTDKSVLAAARESGVDTLAELEEGDPEKEIERRAERGLVDLVVVGHKDIGLVTRWLEGSTSETLVRSCTFLSCSYDDNVEVQLIVSES
jgi:hypothetical protein